MTIGDGAWIGAGAKILDGVTIGDARVDRRRRGRARRRARPGRRSRRAGAGRRRSRSAPEPLTPEWPSSPSSPPALPSVEGGHLVIARSLVAAAREAGHDAAPGHHARLPVRPPDVRLPRHLATDVGQAAGRQVDQVISLRYPSYAVRHPAHVCWLNHTMREYYDLWPRFCRVAVAAGRASRSASARRSIHAVDRWLLTHNVDRGRRAVADDPAPPAARPRREGRGAAAAAAAARVSLRRVRRLHLRRLAADAAQADRSADPRAGRAGGAGTSAPSLPATGRAGPRCEALARSLGRDRPRSCSRADLDEAMLTTHLRGAAPSASPPLERRLRLRDGRGLRVAQGGDHVLATAAGPPSSSATARPASSASRRPPALAAALARLMDDRGAGRAAGHAARRRR